MRIIIFLILLSISSSICAQEKFYTDPLDIPLLLSGSFAELRSNHFHSGIDIKTQGVTGLPVYAAANGYVSRIAVSPTGFGKALYIDHANGTTTVYGHLNSFSEEIENYVIDQQYTQKSFRVNLNIPPDMFIVKKGQEIAKSGNSGSSGGPHLHFEVRDTRTEEPLNPLDYGFSVDDNITPKVFSLLVVPLNDTSQVNLAQQAKSYPVVFYDGKYHLKNNPVIPVYGQIGFAIQANDYFNGTYNKCGINTLFMKVDGETRFTFQLNRFSFSDTRYINSHIVYEEYQKSKRRYIKTWLEPGNQLPIYNYDTSKGLVNITSGKQKVSINLSDTYGNSSELIFNIESIKGVSDDPVEYKTLVQYDQEFVFKESDFSVKIPRGALYKDIKFWHSVKPTTEAFYSEFYQLADRTIPLHTPATIWLKARNLPENLHSKVVMVNVDNDKGLPLVVGGKYENGGVSADIRTMGMFAIMVDTIAPEIVPLSIQNNTLTESGRLRFTIMDELSGIKSIVGLIDGKWALFNYDAKTNRIMHVFDSKRFEMGKQHSINLTVTDYRNNSSTYEATFWK